MTRDSERPLAAEMKEGRLGDRTLFEFEPPRRQERQEEIQQAVKGMILKPDDGRLDQRCLMIFAFLTFLAVQT